MTHCYHKDNRISFSELEQETIKGFSDKKPENLLPNEKEFINNKYDSIFGKIDMYMDKPLYQDISDVLIMPALLHGVHISGLEPLITKRIALNYTMQAPNTISGSEYQKRRETFDGTNFVLIRIYKEMS